MNRSLGSLDEVAAAPAPDHPLTAPLAGPLSGTVLVVKDLVAVAGLPVTAGSLLRAAAPPEPRDAEVVRILRAAGAAVDGTVTLHELAFGVTGLNDRVGFPVHPLDPGRVPGGSSSGSAVAVATGRADLAIGTDTGGSVRIPAALCGVVGFKPAWGRYPMDGVLALAPSLDHLGLLAPALGPVVAAHQVLTGATVQPQAPTRLGVDREALASAAPPVAAAVEAALRGWRDQGVELVDVELPPRATAIEVSSTILLAEAARVHRLTLADPAAAPRIGPDVLARLRVGETIPAADYDAAQQERARITAAVDAVLEGVDAVVGPTVPIPAPTITEARADHPGVTRRLVEGTRLGNLTGRPALSLPAPVPAGALPVGLQVLAADDEQLLGLGLALAGVPVRADDHDRHAPGRFPPPQDPHQAS